MVPTWEYAVFFYLYLIFRQGKRISCQLERMGWIIWKPFLQCAFLVYTVHLLLQIMNLMYFRVLFLATVQSKDKSSTSISLNKIIFFTFKKCFTLAIFLKSWENTKQTGGKKKRTDGAICLSKDFIPQHVFWKVFL